MQMPRRQGRDSTISGSVYLDLAAADWQPDGDKFLD